METYGTQTVPRQIIQQAVEQVFDFRLLSIIDQLNLERPIYYKTAAYGHFGRNDPDFTWENLDKVEALQAAVKEISERADADAEAEAEADALADTDAIVREAEILVH